MNGGVGTVLNRIRFVVLVCFAVLLSISLIQSTDAVPPVSEIYASQIDMMNMVVDVVADEIDNVKSGFFSDVHVVSDKFTHIHEFRLFRNIPSTCVDRGYDVVVCKCGHTEKRNFLELVDHSWGNWSIVENPTVLTEGIKVRLCQWCDAQEDGTVERLVRGMNYLGRLKIPSVGINVGLFRQYQDEGGPIVDAWDSAALFSTTSGCTVIGDHNNQGFNAIKRIVPGDIAEIHNIDGNIDAYVCVDVIQGHNTGDYLSDADGNKLYEVYADKLLCYTCNDHWTNITVVVFEKM